VAIYDLKVENLPGKKQVLADTLNQASVNESPPEEDGIQLIKNIFERSMIS